MNKKNNQYEKLPRGIVIANNKKQAEIKNILTLRDEMVKNSIDPVLIKKFLDEQYHKITKEYDERVKKYNEKQKLKEKNKETINIKKKRDKAVDFLIKSKTFLEEHGASKEYIKKYVDKQYKEINEYYVVNLNSEPESDSDINLDDINFID
jgi:hypothetical protein